MSPHHSKCTYLGLQPWSKSKYIGQTSQSLVDRVLEHLGQALCPPPHTLLDRFHASLRTTSHRVCWIRIRSFSTDVSTMSLLDDELFWLKFLQADLNTAHQAPRKDNGLWCLSPNRYRPLMWIRAAEPGNDTRIHPSSSAWKSMIRDHIAGLNSTFRRNQQILASMLRRPRSMNIHLQNLRRLGHRKVLYLTKMADQICHGPNHALISNVMQTFWKFEKVPVITIRPPKSVNGMSRNHFWRTVLRPWMRAERFFVIKWRAFWTQTPNLKEALSNNTAQARMFPEQLQCDCCVRDDYPARLEGHAFFTLTQALTELHLPAQWTSKCRPWPEPEWTSRVWKDARASLGRKKKSCFRRLGDLIESNMQTLVKAYGLPKRVQNNPDLVTTAHILRAKKFAGPLHVNFADKGGNNLTFS